MKKIIVLALTLISIAVATLGYTRSIGIWNVKRFEKAIVTARVSYDVYVLKLHDEVVYELKVRA